MERAQISSLSPKQSPNLWATEALKLLKNRKSSSPNHREAPELRKLLLRRSPYHLSESNGRNKIKDRRLSADSVLLKQIRKPTMLSRKMRQTNIEPDKLVLSEKELQETAALSNALGALSQFVSKVGSPQLQAAQKANKEIPKSPQSISSELSPLYMLDQHDLIELSNSSSKSFVAGRQCQSWPQFNGDVNFDLGMSDLLNLDLTQYNDYY